MDWQKTYWHSVTQDNDLVWLRVQRWDGEDGISWEVLQQIKNDVFGEDVLAVEVYPPQDDVVNRSNMRHLWASPGLDFLKGLGKKL